MKLRTEIVLFGLAGVLIAAVVGVIGLSSSSRQGAALDEAIQAGQALQASQEADMMHDALRGDVLLALLGAMDNTPERVKEAEAGLVEHQKTFEEALERLKQLPLSADSRAALARTEPLFKAYVNSTSTTITAAKTDAEAGRKAMPAFQSAFTQLETEMAAQSESIRKSGDELNKRAAEGVLQTQLSIVIALLLASVSLITVAWWLANMLSRPMGHALEVAERLAAGELGHTVLPQGNDETRLLLQSMVKMQRNLSSIVGDVQRNAEQVATASAEIARGNQDLSERTERQAGALQVTASTMDELGATVSHNAGNAQQASLLASSATAVAVKGGAVVSQVVETMRGINDSSRKIADITSVIDGIAFQTNILALNAAVEAARAGEQGRGFAVVATEVRSLAQRSAAAAREIKALTTASVERVEHGTVLVDDAGRTMAEIVTSIQRVADIVGEISTASAEQSAGVQQIGHSVAQMDQATQQNAALVEESAAAADSLREQADQLVRAVGAFRL